MSFTGNKDTDFLVLNQLTDNDLAAVCSVNKYARKLCEDEGFWKRRLFSNSIILNLEKEYLKEERSLEKVLSSLKIFLEFENWKNLYVFFFFSGDKYQRENLKDLLRNSIVRFDLYDHSDFLEYLKKIDEIKNIPKWINVKEFKKDLSRKRFWELSRPSSGIKFQIEMVFKDFLRPMKNYF